MGGGEQYTVRVSNVSPRATEQDIYDFFAFSGEISSIYTRPSTEVPGTQEAFVTFHEERSLETALLLTGAVIADKPVTVELAQGYEPQSAPSASSHAAAAGTGPKVPTGDSWKRAESVMASLLAKGYILGKDALEKARAMDQQHEISTKAKLHAETLSRSATEMDAKYSISKKLAETSATFTRSLSTVDEKYHVTGRTKEAFSAAEASLAEAGQYVMKNKYVSSGASWLAGALGQLKTIVTDVQQQAAEKVSKAEEERASTKHSGRDGISGEKAPNESAKGADSMGLSDHGPPSVRGYSATAAPVPVPGPIPVPVTPPAPSSSPSPAAKSALSSSEPPVF